MGSNKPRGLQAARKLRDSRRENRWADKLYKKRALGNVFKTSPTGGSSHAKGIVLEKVGVESKQPNSAIRKCVRVQLIKNGKKVTAFVPNDGCLNFVDENDEVLISGFGRSGKAKGDIPGKRRKSQGHNRFYALCCTCSPTCHALNFMSFHVHQQLA
ncbi:hypothetical protein Agabi119p4_1955 [Agaricus bisporus var. burnettii]|uniref:40S ribosomal protein S23 n=1 Tax=Agaricus bisporus var. burnettii TaxID=192524 RepID=A0A8H7KJI0_AGABI|nr:hypothetical protein Agabi119p4_1955 [Agaricus bisporus var. burnettii]